MQGESRAGVTAAEDDARAGHGEGDVDEFDYVR